MDALEVAASRDVIYQDMLTRCKLLEKRFDQAVRRLPEDTQAIIWDYVMHCEDMSKRLLELACENY